MQSSRAPRTFSPLVGDSEAPTTAFLLAFLALTFFGSGTLYFSPRTLRRTNLSGSSCVIEICGALSQSSGQLQTCFRVFLGRRTSCQCDPELQMSLRPKHAQDSTKAPLKGSLAAQGSCKRDRPPPPFTHTHTPNQRISWR